MPECEPRAPMDWELPIYNMHRFFLVEELVSAVLQFLGQDGQGSLAAVACSCRALSDMALDELWAEAEFWDLAKTMRADLWEVTHERHMPRGDWALHATQDVWTLKLIGDLSTVPLLDLGPRFAAYARRMRKLHFDPVVKLSADGRPSLRWVLHESVFQCWTHMARRMFPHVSSLIIPMHFFTRHHEHAFLEAVAQPGDVTSLTLKLASTSTAWISLPPDMRKLLVALAPRLRVMDVHSLGRSSDNRDPPVPWIEDLIEHATELHDIDCKISLPFSLVGRAIETGYLRSLTLGCPVYGTPSGAAEITWPAQALGNLNLLSVADDNPSALLAQALVARCGTALRCCTIKLCARDAYVFADVVTLVCAVSQLPGIHTLEIDIAKDSRTEPKTEQTMAIFKALCNLSYLGTLRLSLGFGHTFSVACLQTLVKACVFLSFFTTAYRQSEDDARAITTLLEFLSMLQYRPMCLHLPVHVRITEFPDEATRTTFGTHAYSAYLVYEPISDAKERKFQEVVGALLPRVSQMIACRDSMPVRCHIKTEEGIWIEGLYGL